MADIHFDYRLAIAAIKAGADKIRINPGNIGSRERIQAVVEAARERDIPIRVGVNSGSLETVSYTHLMVNNELWPRHVAVIMDGNGRWAQKNKVSRLQGHNAGMLAMKEIIKRADIIGIKYLTVYAFSTENWQRSAEEVGGIFGLLVKYVASELKELNENNVKVRILGDYTQIPKTCLLYTSFFLRGQ